jgi:2-iminobutanoate/2-iminopropanoate deaminase
MKQAITLPDHPAKYPYFSDIVKTEGMFVFVSAQAGRGDDGSWSGSFAEQLDRAIANLRRTLEAGGASLDDVVQLTAFLSDARNGDADCRHGNVFNEVYARHFRANWPVRSRVQAVLHDPRCLVELDAMAVIDD